MIVFLYSQDLSNCKTEWIVEAEKIQFLYSQDLSNCKTFKSWQHSLVVFLYSQDLSNCKTYGRVPFICLQVFVLSRFK